MPQIASATDTAVDSAASQAPSTSNRPPVRRFFLLLYMLRVPLLTLVLVGVALPLGFGTSMLHGLADLQPAQVLSVSFFAMLLVSAAITCGFLVLLYAEQRADGRRGVPFAEPHVSTRSVVVLYALGTAAYLALLVAVFVRMRDADPASQISFLTFVLRALLGLAFASIVIVAVFFLVLRIAKPEGSDAVEVFVAPVFLILRGKLPGLDAGIRKTAATSAKSQTRTYSSRRGPISSFFARLLGPGYCSYASGQPPALYPGHRFAAISLLVFLALYLYAGSGVYRELAHGTPVGSSVHLDSVLNDVLLLLTFWCWLLSGLTFFLDRFRVPLLPALALALYATSWIGPSDHLFQTVPTTQGIALPAPADTLAHAPDHIILVAAAGGGIQSAAWTAEVLCNLRAELQPDFASSVLAISGVSGGSIGTMFYLRCLEAPPNDATPASWAAKSSLEAVGWGLAYPDLWRAILPPVRFFLHADRGWALERSVAQNAAFARTRQLLGDPRTHANWPVLLLNSTLSESGDPITFSDAAFPPAPPLTDLHALRGFHATYPAQDVLLETAARMSAAFPYVSPAARPPDNSHFEHFADGGYFDNSGLFALGQWIKTAADPDGSADPAPQTISAKPRKILLLQIDAFPDFGPNSAEKEKVTWYFQIFAPIETILNVRSESQVVRDETSGKDLQELLRARGYETTFLTVRYVPSAASSHLPTTYIDRLKGSVAVQCPTNPPLSWHLTPLEQVCIEGGWRALVEPVTRLTRDFLQQTSPMKVSDPSGCDSADSNVLVGVQVRRCAAVGPPPSQRVVKSSAVNSVPSLAAPH
jgi:hypothetical protein